jgi:hypothetical protein
MMEKHSKSGMHFRNEKLPWTGTRNSTSRRQVRSNSRDLEDDVCKYFPLA